MYVELNRDQMSQLGISEDVIIAELREKNAVTDAGRVEVGPEFITITPTGGITSVEQFESILLSGDSARQIYLRDVANVRRGYVEPQSNLIRYDGSPAIGLGISTVSGGNVVRMGEALSATLGRKSTSRPSAAVPIPVHGPTPSPISERRADLLQLLSPVQVSFLVEPSLQFDEASHLFARFGGADQ